MELISDGICYIGLGSYEDNQDGIFRYWKNCEKKSEFYNFLKNTDYCILLLTIGQQANLGEVDFIEKSNFDFVIKLANKYFDEYDMGILLKKSLFIDWSIEKDQRSFIKEELEANNNFDNIFIIKSAYDELISDLNEYIELWNDH